MDNRTQAAAGRIAIRLRLLASGRDGIAPRLLAEFPQLGCLVADAVNVIRARRDCSDQDSFHKVDVVDADPEGDTRSVSDSLPVEAVGISVSSAGFKTLLVWLLISIAVTVVSCC
jgi:hypothetical protein